jgi:hypothetical protein
VPRLILNRIKDRLSTRISLSQECKDPTCRHPFSIHHPILGCTFHKLDFGRNGFCQCDGFVAVDVKAFAFKKEKTA